MQQQATDNFNQQPVLPSYSEATKTPSQPSNVPNFNNYYGNYTQPNAPVDGFITAQMPQPQYSYQQTNYNQSSIPTASPYPPAHVTNAYLQEIPIHGQVGQGPTTVHIIRPVVTEQPSTCTRRTRVIATVLVVLAITLGVIRLGVQLSR